MKIKEILQEENIEKEQKKLALEQVLNLSKPEIILNKERKLTKKEYKEIENYLYTLELENGYIQELGEHEEEYVPDFNMHM